MTEETILANARLIMKDEVVYGSLRIRDGIIAEINPGKAISAGALDMEGDFVAPGLVELHTDNLERHINPRPRVKWPHRAAIMAHDRELAGTGITTVFDAIRVGSIMSNTGRSYGKYARQMADEILAMRDTGALRISHHIHLRAEICSETLLEELDEFGPADGIGILSMMDHTPGQRQFRDVQKFEDYVCSKHNMSREHFGEYITLLYKLREQFGERHAAASVAAAVRLGATLASHDDTTAAQVAQSHLNGVTIAEFPTTVEAADACHARGITIMIGAPNLVRGKSHSGNVAALDLAQRDRLDILSSDYIPAGLLMAAVQLGEAWGNIAKGMATVTRNPANSVGMTDRGSLEVGQRADIIRFGIVAQIPDLRRVLSAGTIVA